MFVDQLLTKVWWYSDVLLTTGRKGVLGEIASALTSTCERKNDRSHVKVFDRTITAAVFVLSESGDIESRFDLVSVPGALRFVRLIIHTGYRDE